MGIVRLNQRIAELEAENARLKAKIAAIRKLVENQKEADTNG